MQVKIDKTLGATKPTPQGCLFLGCHCCGNTHAYLVNSLTTLTGKMLPR